MTVRDEADSPSTSCLHRACMQPTGVSEADQRRLADAYDTWAFTVYGSREAALKAGYTSERLAWKRMLFRASQYYHPAHKYVVRAARVISSSPGVWCPTRCSGCTSQGTTKTDSILVMFPCNRRAAGDRRAGGAAV